MSLVVRAARAEDAPAWRAIVLEASEEGRAIVTRPPEVFPPEELARRFALDPSVHCFLVAEEAGRVMGVLGGKRGDRHANRHTADVGLTVAAAHRGKGVGRALMLAFEDWARAHAVTKLCLGVFSDNERGLRLYRSLGYVEEGVRRGQYVVAGVAKDEVVMAKFLA